MCLTVNISVYNLVVHYVITVTNTKHQILLIRNVVIFCYPQKMSIKTITGNKLVVNMISIRLNRRGFVISFHVVVVSIIYYTLSYCMVVHSNCFQYLILRGVVLY